MLVQRSCDLDLVDRERPASQRYAFVSEQAKDAGLGESVGVAKAWGRCARLVLPGDLLDEGWFEAPSK